MRVKAVVAYDGTGYSGFQRQTNAYTVQEALEQVLEKLTGHVVRIVAAGRTDAGVHAEGQVIAFVPRWRHPLTDLHRGMNALLPEQIAVRDMMEVPEGFHPRYDARRRRYRYTIYQAPVRNPLVARYSLHVDRDLDLDAMQAAAEALVGQHDFAAFGSPPSGRSTVREVYRARWTGTAPWRYFEVEANAFLYKMVRMLVGTLLRVGDGKLTPEAFAALLVTQDRQNAGPAVDARGLCLKSVTYA